MDRPDEEHHGCLENAEVLENEQGVLAATVVGGEVHGHVCTHYMNEGIAGDMEHEVGLHVPAATVCEEDDLAEDDMDVVVLREGPGTTGSATSSDGFQQGPESKRVPEGQKDSEDGM